MVGVNGCRRSPSTRLRTGARGRGRRMSPPLRLFFSYIRRFKRLRRFMSAIVWQRKAAPPARSPMDDQFGKGIKEFD